MNIFYRFTIKLEKILQMQSSRHKIYTEYNKRCSRSTSLNQPTQRRSQQLVNQLAVYLNYLFMIGASARMALQALAFHTPKENDPNNTGLIHLLSSADGTISGFVNRYAANVFLCLSCVPLPLFFVGLHWLMYGRVGQRSGVLWQYAYHLVLVDEDLRPPAGDDGDTKIKVFHFVLINV